MVFATDCSTAAASSLGVVLQVLGFSHRYSNSNLEDNSLRALDHLLTEADVDLPLRGGALLSYSLQDLYVLERFGCSGSFAS